MIGGSRASLVAVVADLDVAALGLPAAVDPDVHVAVEAPLARAPVVLRLRALPVTRDPLPGSRLPVPVAADPDVAALLAVRLRLRSRRRLARAAVVDDDDGRATTA